MEVQEEAAVLPKQRKRNDEPVERRADSRNGPAFDQDDGIDFAQDEDLLAHDIPYGWGKAAPAPAARPAETTPSPVRRRVKKPEPPCKATPEPASQVTPSIPAKRRSLDSASAVGNALRGVPGDQEAGGSLKAAVPEPAARRPAQVIGGQAGGASAAPSVFSAICRSRKSPWRRWTRRSIWNPRPSRRALSRGPSKVRT